MIGLDEKVNYINGLLLLFIVRLGRVIGLGEKVNCIEGLLLIPNPCQTRQCDWSW